MAADATLMQSGFIRLPPSGSAIAAAAIRAILVEPDPERTLRRGLMERLSPESLSFHRSGREALRVAFKYLAASTGRAEVIVPAYCCPSIPAAAVAAGLRVRLVDVDLTGQIDAESLRALPRERAAGLVIGNLFGVPEPIAAALELAREAGVPVVDDAAQSIGSRSREGPVGSRGDVGVLSFGRGKPLSALGGGALAWKLRPEAARRDLTLGIEADAVGMAQRTAAVARASIYDLARVPFVLRILAAIPALGIGTTVYDPGFRQGAIQGSSVALAAVLLAELDRMNLSRARLAGAIAERVDGETHFRPLLAKQDDVGIYPRLGLLAPDARSRDGVLQSVAWLGVTGMYPTALDRIPALAPYLAGGTECPGAREFCARLVTVPTHAGLRGPRLDALIAELAAHS